MLASQIISIFKFSIKIPSFLGWFFLCFHQSSPGLSWNYFGACLMLAITLLTMMAAVDFVSYSFFSNLLYFWYLKKCSLEIQALNKYLPTRGQLNCKLLTKTRAVLECYLPFHTSMFFSVCILVNKLKMEHLPNIAITLKRSSLGLPWFLTHGMLVQG